MSLSHLFIANTYFWCINSNSSCCDVVLAARALRCIIMDISGSKHPEHIKFVCTLKMYKFDQNVQRCFFLKFKDQNKTIRNKRACEKISLLIVFLEFHFPCPENFSGVIVKTNSTVCFKFFGKTVSLVVLEEWPAVVLCCNLHAPETLSSSTCLFI